MTVVSEGARLRLSCVQVTNASDLMPEASDFDADGALTREFLLRRGCCCENGCRNCPYGFAPDKTETGEARGSLA